MTDPAQQQPDPGSKQHIPLGPFTAAELKRREEAIAEIGRTTDEDKKSTLFNHQVNAYGRRRKMIEARQRAGEDSPEFTEELKQFQKWTEAITKLLDDDHDSRGHNYVGGA